MDSELMERLRDVGVMLKLASKRLKYRSSLTSVEWKALQDVQEAVFVARNAVSQAGVELKIQERGSDDD